MFEFYYVYAMKFSSNLLFIFATASISAQNLPQKLDQAVKTFLSADAAYAANLSFYVSDDSGKMIYEYQGNKGLTTASTQKIFTAAAALESLGKDYRYETTVSISGRVVQGVLKGDLILSSNGDPTLGSWRYEGYKPEDFQKKIIEAIKNQGVTRIDGNIFLDDSFFDFQVVPGGWPWNDMGNYYGPGVWGINWRENQFDLNLRGSHILGTNVELPNVVWVNDLKTAGSSDRSIIYTAPHSPVAHISGTLPNKAITVAGAMPNPPLTLGNEISNWLKESKIEFGGEIISANAQRVANQKVTKYPDAKIILTYPSPPMEKIVYWFLRKSVNMYGETLVKTFGKENKGEGSFSSGVEWLKDFWKAKGIKPQMINFADGSGLSPQNYASARAEVQALLWIKKQPWFATFYEALPTHGIGIKAKSGTMRNTKSYAGYHNGYVFSIIVNNYQGNASESLLKILYNLK